jgi:hypothetical protein
MAKKKGIPRLRVKARIASKVMEKDLLAKAKMLMDDPELIIPECSEDCGSCPFKKTQARLEKIQRHKDDQGKLAKLSRRGDKLARAYAATIGLVHEEKTPYLATATYSGGTITYALRGKTDKEKLMGVQNFDSAKWRVLSVLDLVNKRGLHFYSYGDEFICTGKMAKPPQEYVRLAAESVGAGKLQGDTYSCPHDPSAIDHLEFDWITADRKILLCDQCVGKTKNTLSKIAEGMAVPKVLNEFEISIVRPLNVVNGKDGCENLMNMPVAKDLLEKYSSGEIDNRGLIEKHMESVHESLADLNKKVYVKGDKCFGSDVESFVKELTEDDMEMRAVIGLLSGIDHPIVVEPGNSVNKLLSEYWTTNGMDAMRAVMSKELAEKYYKDDDESKNSPLKVIRTALRDAEHAAISAQIPKYSCLSQYGEFADEVAREYKTGGQSGAILVLDANKSNDHRIRSMTHAFYLALGVTNKAWRFTDEEKEYGKHLQTFAKKLLESEDPDEHHAAFATFLREAGCTDEVKKA